MQKMDAAYGFDPSQWNHSSFQFDSSRLKEKGPYLHLYPHSRSGFCRRAWVRCGSTCTASPGRSAAGGWRPDLRPAPPCTSALLMWSKCDRVGGKKMTHKLHIRELKDMLLFIAFSLEKEMSCPKNKVWVDINVPSFWFPSSILYGFLCQSKCTYFFFASRHQVCPFNK